MVVCGHTHIQFDRVVGTTRVLNAGSVGMPPFGETGAYWLLLGDGVELRHTLYDLAEAAARIQATTYPQAEYFAQSHVRDGDARGLLEGRPELRPTHRDPLLNPSLQRTAPVVAHAKLRRFIAAQSCAGVTPREAHASRRRLDVPAVGCGRGAHGR